MSEKNVMVAVADSTVAPGTLEQIKELARTEPLGLGKIELEGESITFLAKAVEGTAIGETVLQLNQLIPDDGFTPGEHGVMEIEGGVDLALFAANAGTESLMAGAPPEALATVISAAGKILPGGKPFLTPIAPRPAAASTSTSASNGVGVSGNKDKKDQLAAQETPKEPAEPDLKDLHAALWDSLEKEDKSSIAKEYFGAIISAKKTNQTAILWKGAPASQLIERFDNAKADPDAKKLLTQMIRANAGVSDTDSSLYTEAVNSEKERVNLLKETVKAAQHLNT